MTGSSERKMVFGFGVSSQHKVVKIYLLSAELKDLPHPTEHINSSMLCFYANFEYFVTVVSYF